MWGLSVGLTTHLGKLPVTNHLHNASESERNNWNRPQREKQTLRFGTWNIRTLAVPGAADILSEELHKYKMDIVALQETRWPLAGKINTKEYIIYYSGCDTERYRRGVGFAISKRLERAVTFFEPKDERMCNIRVKGKFNNISIMSIYAPTEDADDEEKDRFYERVEEEWKKLPSYDTKILMGDFNAKVGRENIWEEVTRKESLHESSNENGVRLLSLAVAGDMRVMSTSFPRKDIHKATWISPDGNTANQIDHVLIDRRHSRNITNVRTIRNAEMGTDHYLVLVNICQRIRVERNKIQNKTIQIDTDKLKDKNIRKEFQLKLANRFEILDTSEGERQGKEETEKGWTDIKNTIQKCAEEVCGRKKRINKKPWFDEECNKAVAERREAKYAWLNNQTEQTKETYMVKQRETVKTLRQKKRKWINKVLEKAEQDRTINNTRDFYRSIRFFKKGYMPKTYGIRNKLGEIIIQKEKGMEVWREYFQDLLNGEVQERDGELQETYQNVQPLINNPTLEEVTNAIKMLKNNKAPGGDGIKAEVLKAGGQITAQQIHKLISRVWEEEDTPSDWKEAIVVPIHKKGSKNDCNNYRGISLLNTTYKILSKIIQTRLEEYTSTIIGEHQAGFTKGKSTTDQIYILKESIAKYHEYKQSFYCIFIDFTKAYDSLDRNRLWEIMEKQGIPNKLTRLARLSVTDSKCKVKVEGQLSNDFSVNTGVRQGDGMSPMLFNIALEEALQRVKSSDIGIKIGKTFNILAFADDVAIMAHKKDDLKELIRILIEETGKVGLQINDSKTKFMKCGRRNGQEEDDDDILQIESHSFQKVNSFQYLGVLLSDNNNEELEVTNRINSANRSLHACNRLLSSKLLSHSTKLRIYKTIIRPVLMYGSETWAMSKKIEKKIITFENKVLRKIYGPTLEDGMWRIRHNIEIRERYKDPDIVAEVKSRRLRWFGHIVRRDEGSTTRNVLDGNPEGRRPPGRPKLRWRDQVQKDIRRLGRSENEAEDRDIWRQCVGEAKYLLGYQWPLQ